MRHFVRHSEGRTWAEGAPEVLRETCGSRGKEEEADENCIMGRCMIGTAHQSGSGDQIKDDVT